MLTAMRLNERSEPVFASMVNDPRFREVAMQYLAPRSYGEGHHTSSGSSLGHPLQCSGCAPFTIIAVAAMNSTPPTRVVEPTAIEPGNGRRRDVARSFGPKPKGNKR